MKKTFKKEYIFYLIIIILFASLATFLSTKHEFWPDEINAWLIAKDSNVIHLFTKYLRNDGHPALFHLIIKLFQTLGLQYKHFSVISIIFSTLGVAVFLFKSNFKWYIKALFPFTVFVFFLYTVTTRGYCLLLLLLSLTAAIWDKKNEKCILYTILLTLLISSETYTMIMAGSMYLLWIIDYIKKYKVTKKHNKKILSCLIILFFVFLFTSYYICPRPTSTYIPKLVTEFSFSKIFIMPYVSNSVIASIFSIVIILFLLSLYIKEKTKLTEATILLLPLIIFMTFIYCSPWHFGILFIYFMFIFWIQKIEKPQLNIFLLIVCIVQVYWSINTSIYEYKELYSSSEVVANFIKQYDYENLKIFGQTYYEIGPNSYFDKSIYFNWDNDVRFLYADKSNNYFNYNPKDAEAIISYDPDIIVTTQHIDSVYKLDDKIFEDKYDSVEFPAYTYLEDHWLQNMTTKVYVRKGLEKK